MCMIPLQRRLVSTLLLTLFAACGFASSAVILADDYFPPPDSEGGWRTPTNGDQTKTIAGIDPARLDQAFDFTSRCTRNGGLLVVRHGYLVFEKYFGRGQRNANPDMASTGKAFTSIACGIMLHEFHDRIPDGLETKVFTPAFLPEAFPLDDPRKGNIKLGQLLCMSAGFVGEGGSPTGIVMGKAQALKSGPGQDIRNLDQSSIHVPLWIDPGAGYSYASCRTAYRVDRAAARDRHGVAGLHQRAAGKADGMGRLGILHSPRRLRHAPCQRCGKHRAARNRYAALWLLPASRRQMEGPPARAFRLHRDVQQALAVQSALSVCTSVREQL